MYKVFINDRPIIFVSFDEIIDLCSFTTTYIDPKMEVFDELLSGNQVSKPDSEGVLIKCSDVMKCFHAFKTLFKIVEAAGGMVQSETGKTLWIHRLGKWDLPKGKIEKGESNDEAALREVEEECGITDLKLGTFVGTTYHTYEHKGKFVLKPTYWYQMHVKGEPQLTPQTEEAILDCRWLSDMEVENMALKDTYGSITEIFNRLFTRDKP